MKQTTILKSPLCAAAFLFAACVNQIPDAQDDESRLPIAFQASITNETATRVTDNAFDKGDKVGLFANISGTGFGEDFYINNARLECVDNGSLQPEENIYYPDGGGNLDFTAYYPYNENGLQNGKTTLSVAVSADQSSPEGFSTSDFMVASESNVKAGQKTVNLEFKHALSKLKIELATIDGSSIDVSLVSDLNVVACNFYTKAVYDFSTSSFSDFSAADNLIFSGEWMEEDGRLSGKEVLVFPGAIKAGEQYLSVEWDGKIYTCPLHSVDLEGNTQRTIELRIDPITEDIVAGMAGQISPWEEKEDVESEGDINLESLSLGVLTFNVSNIYQVFSGGRPVAEICREYLLADNVDARAIVLYPAAEQTGGEMRGTVLELEGEPGAVHGGSVVWEKETNKLAYTPGSSEAYRQLFVKADGTVVFSRPDEPSRFTVAASVLRDGRGSSVAKYGMVKIGTQYWLRENLYATADRAGNALSKLTKQSHGVAGYFNPSGTDIYFYNGELLMECELAPGGWKIPDVDDWERLDSYIEGNVAVLKAGEWKASDVEDGVAPVSNLTGFNGYPVGMWHNGQHWSNGMLTAFWALDKGQIPEQIYYLTGSGTRFVMSGPVSSASTEKSEFYKAISVRCIKAD